MKDIHDVVIDSELSGVLKIAGTGRAAGFGVFWKGECWCVYRSLEDASRKLSDLLQQEENDLKYALELYWEGVADAIEGM